MTISLEEGQKGEEEDPEKPHGVPVPGYPVYQNLAALQVAGDVKAYERGNEGCDSEEEMEGVNAGDEIEEVAALIASEVNVLNG